MKEFMLTVAGVTLFVFFMAVLLAAGFSKGWNTKTVNVGRDCDALGYFILQDDGYHKYECRLIATSSTKDHYDWVTE